MTPQRSLLYVPAADDAVIRKASSRGADVVVLDLEDALHPLAKVEARHRLERLWPELDGRRFIRVNGAGTPWHDEDLDLAARLRPPGVVVPKCEDPVVVERTAARVAAPLLLMIETARGVLASAELARVAGVVGLVFGAADFRRSVRAVATPDEYELLVARSTVVLAARGAGVGAFDTPWFEYRDPVGLDASARRARAIGFDGKTAIHPGQVAAINLVFSPSDEEISRARRVVEALEHAANVGMGVATVDGEMVEALHAEEAKRTLALAEALRRR